ERARPGGDLLLFPIDDDGDGPLRSVVQRESVDAAGDGSGADRFRCGFVLRCRREGGEVLFTRGRRDETVGAGGEPEGDGDRCAFVPRAPTPCCTRALFRLELTQLAAGDVCVRVSAP